MTLGDMSTLTLPKNTAQILHELTGEERPDIALQLVLRDSIEHRLMKIKVSRQGFREKYGMSFDEYDQQWEAEDKDEDYTWEAERDYLEWEALVTRQHRLEATYNWLA
ncbi:MAG: hypothetical protein MAG431_01287 [Chloroflexi bacterium]|nr:hypothetical protein [Chloroflexota bacterium]